MATKAQIEANRRNAKKSTGPTSPEGKEKVSQNAIRHGLLTAATLVAGEDPQEFAEFAKTLRYHYRPETAMEAVLVARIADCLWRLERLTKVEAGAYAPVSKTSYLPDQVQPTNRERSESVNPGAIERHLAFRPRMDEFELIQRYEAHLDRKLNKTIEELERIQFARIHRVHPYHLRRMRPFAASRELDFESGVH